MGKKMRNFKRWFRKRRSRPRGLEDWLYEPKTPHRRGNKSSRLPQRSVALVALLLVVVFLGNSFYRFDRRILPLVLGGAELRLQTEINTVINSVVHEIIAENQITAADFILQNVTSDSRPVLSVNTILVNEICNASAKAISARLNNLDPVVVSVPIGMIFNLDTLSQVGPRFTFTMAPIGNALVDYDTNFIAVGINQTHFSVWLTVEAVVRVINPVQSSEIHVTRHVSLVDTIISGAVPETYLNLDTPASLFGN
jgi:sporulation protein YunB